jgi:hypothetical protein
MLAPDSRPPKQVEIVLNSGQANAKKTQAKVLGVDRRSDLAVLAVGAAEGMPAPLRVKPAAGLQELDKVIVFGFPLGMRLGKEISVRESSVSALRRRDGVLDKVQVNGGMDPGSSGGPVVDTAGDVVGVAVSGYEGRTIDFAIPGERVTAVLGGRLSNLLVGHPFVEAGRVSLPVTMEMIDPRNLIKSAAVEVWTGSSVSEPVATGTKQPPPRPGDSPRQRIELPCSGGVARGDVALPELPHGKIYFLQPVFATGGETVWDSATHFDFRPDSAVERKPASLRLRQTPGTSRQVSLSAKNVFRPGGGEGGGLVIVAGANFKEHVAAVDSSGSTLRMDYTRVKGEAGTDGDKPKRVPLTDLIEKNLNRMVAVLRLDTSGNPRQGGGLDPKILLSGGVPGAGTSSRAATPVPVTAGASADLLKQLIGFHKPVQDVLEVMSVPLPNEDNCPPGKAWTASRAQLVDTPGDDVPIELELTYTYLGQRTRNGRAEAVIAVDGVVRGKGGNESVGGRSTGTAVVDLATGTVTHAELRSVLDMPVAVAGRVFRYATLVNQLDRTP